MTLRTKLLLAQLPLILSLIVIGVVSRRTIHSLEHASLDILKDNHLSVLAAQRMRSAVDAMARTALAHAHGRRGADAAATSARRATFERELRFQEGNITETGEREMTERVRKQWERFQHDFDRALAAQPQQAQALYFDSLEPAVVALETATEDISAVNQDAMVAKSNRTRKRAESITAIMLAVNIAACLIGILASVYLTNRLTRPLSVLNQAVRRLGQGDLAARVRVHGQDEIAQVAGEFNTMAERLAEYRSSSLGELLQAQQSSQAAIDSLPDPVLVLQLGGTLLNANQAATDLFKVDPEAMNEDTLARSQPEVRAVISRVREHIASGRGPYSPKGLEDAFLVTVRDGQRYFLTRGTPVHGEDGSIVGLTLLFQDVTKLRRFDELKTDLVATVAHEFRTPLTSLRMALHLCTGDAVGPLTPKQAELLFAAREDCERLQGIVDDLLDLSRIQAGKIELHTRSVSAGALLEEAVDEHRIAARERDIQLEVGAPTIDRPVNADPDRIRLVLANLVTNAIRHTPANGHVAVRAAPADDQQVRFEVSDTGPGIAPEHLPRLFDRFYRVPGGPSGGAGLGLYICKEVVEAHGGRVGIESELGHGSIFWFTVPAAKALPEMT